MRFWFTPGGGMEQGESVVAAAQRELEEETGLTDVELGPAVWYGEHTLLFNGVPTRCKETFLIAQTFGGTLSHAGWDEGERRSILDLRWWTIDELRVSRELIVPRLLASRVGELRRRFEATEGLTLELVDLR
jgi:8-oxo-dGTP pyrophosphatase MutT (NUDIX family)